MDDLAELRSKSREIFRDALVWDTTFGWLMGSPHPETLPRFRAAGFDHISLTVGVDLLGPEIVLREMGPVYAMCAREPDKYVLASDVASIDAAKKAGKLALTFNLQGTNGVAGNIEMVEIFYRLGVRSMLLAYNKKNLVGDGCTERTDGGLSRFGVSLVKEMNRVGMLVDGSHSGYRTTMDAMEVAEAPFIFSHSSAYAVFLHYRNIKDDQILACAKTGGVIGVCGLWHKTYVRKAKPRVRWLTHAQAERLLKALPAHQQDMMLFALATGLRQGNIKRLTWEQVDLSRRIVTIGHGETKNDEALGVPLNDLAVSVLRRRMGVQHEHVFTFKGRPLGQVNTKTWRDALGRAGITDFRWHDLRHTWASWLRQNDVPTWALQELGGWKSETMVRRYAHMSTKHLAPYADQLTFEVTPESGGQPPFAVLPEGHKKGHSAGRARLRLVACTDLSH